MNRVVSPLDSFMFTADIQSCLISTRYTITMLHIHVCGWLAYYVLFAPAATVGVNSLSPTRFSRWSIRGVPGRYVYYTQTIFIRHPTRRAAQPSMLRVEAHQLPATLHPLEEAQVEWCRHEKRRCLLDTLTARSSSATPCTK